MPFLFVLDLWDLSEFLVIMQPLFVTSILLLVGFSLAIWPEPQQFKHGNTTLWLSPSARFTYRCKHPEPHRVRYGYFANSIDFAGRLGHLPLPWLSKAKANPNSVATVDEIMKKMLDRVQKEIYNSEFVPWKFHPRNQLFEPSAYDSHHAIDEVVVTERSSKNESRTRDYIYGAEDYLIEISKAGRVEISTSSAIVTLRALQTFQQLFYAHSSGKGVYTPYGPVSILDSPKWPH